MLLPGSQAQCPPLAWTRSKRRINQHKLTEWSSLCFAFILLANLIYQLTSSTWRFSKIKYQRSTASEPLFLSGLKGIMRFHQWEWLWKSSQGAWSHLQETKQGSDVHSTAPVKSDHWRVSSNSTFLRKMENIDPLLSLAQSSEEKGSHSISPVGSCSGSSSLWTWKGPNGWCTGANQGLNQSCELDAFLFNTYDVV